MNPGSETMPTQHLWTLKSKGSEAAFGGNDGYADKPESLYVFDSTVKNHDKLQVGDLVVIADKYNIIGFARIASVSAEKNIVKTRYSCPVCGTNEINPPRKTKKPKYKCRKKHEFSKRKTTRIKVTRYTANYGKMFIPATQNSPTKSIADYYINPNRYYSIQRTDISFLRRHHPATLKQLLANRINSGLQAINSIDKDYQPYQPSGNDDRSISNAPRPTRQGQDAFKRALIKNYGHICMLTENAITQVLQASHICPYRGKTDNHIENGLLFRSDLHILFDKNLLGIHPKSLKVSLHPSLRTTEYKKLAGRRLKAKGLYSPSPAALLIRWAEFKKGPTY